MRRYLKKRIELITQNISAVRRIAKGIQENTIDFSVSGCKPKGNFTFQCMPKNTFQILIFGMLSTQPLDVLYLPKVDVRQES